MWTLEPARATETALPPLPPGEGWGEGALPAAHQAITRVGTLPSPGGRTPPPQPHSTPHKRRREGARRPWPRHLALLAAALPAIAAAQPAPPRFEDFPAPPAHTALQVPPRLATASDRAFRTRLREAAREPPDFAGHYKLALWGCGASCVMGAAIDARTGRVTWLPFTVCCAPADVTEPLAYRRNSRLLVVRGSRNEAGGGTYYYALNPHGFTLLRADEGEAARP